MEGERRKKQEKYKEIILHQNDVKERKNWKKHIVTSEWLWSTFSLVKIYNKSEKQKDIENKKKELAIQVCKHCAPSALASITSQNASPTESTSRTTSLALRLKILTFHLEHMEDGLS